MSTAEIACTAVDELLGEAKPKKRVDPPDNLILGQIDPETGAVRIEKGNTEVIGRHTHAGAGMYRHRGPVFRYFIPTGIVYWWTRPSQTSKSCAEFAIEQAGYPIKGHRVMLQGSTDMLDAHGWRTW